MQQSSNDPFLGASRRVYAGNVSSTIQKMGDNETENNFNITWIITAFIVIGFFILAAFSFMAYKYFKYRQFTQRPLR